MRKLTVILVLVVSMTRAWAQAKSDSFKTSDGVKIHYLEAGSGKPIVFIPGWTMPAWIWEKQIGELSKKYHVVAVDPRSQGESDKPTYGHLPEIRARDYKELVDHLGLKSPLLVGWSLACGELVMYAKEFSLDNVGGLVLVDGLLSDKPIPEMFGGMSGWMNQLQSDRKKQADGFVRSMYKKPQSEDYLERVVDASMQTPADTAVVLIYNMLAVTDFSGFDKLNKPVMFIYEPQLQQTADFVKAKFGDKVRIEKFEDAGHALFVDDADRFNHLIDDFAQELAK